jgi:hypothetical protein
VVSRRILIPFRHIAESKTQFRWESGLHSSLQPVRFAAPVRSDGRSHRSKLLM